MKTLSKLLVILLVLAMLFSLAACGDSKKAKNRDDDKDDSSKSDVDDRDDDDDDKDDDRDDDDDDGAPKSVIGRWKYTVEFDEWMDSVMDAMMQEDVIADGNKRLADLIKKAFSGCSITIYMGLADDNTYTLSVDEAFVNDSLEKFEANLPDLMPDFIAAYAERNGMSMSELEEYLAAQGKTVNDGMETLKSNLIFFYREIIKQLPEKMEEVGTYTYYADELTFTSEKGNQNTFVIKLSHNQLMVNDIQGDSNTDSLFNSILPMVFTRCD